jgi:hypothetical protein
MWDMYCKELGRSVALGEQAYFFRTLQDAIPDVEVESGVGFEGLEAPVRSLVDAGYTPDIVIAPIAYMVGFMVGHTPEGIPLAKPIWERDGLRDYLRIGNSRLTMYWSSSGRPLNRFIVFDSTRGHWTVKLDAQDGGRLTIAIGEQITPVHGVVWLAESISKYDLDDLAGFRSFRPDAPPDREFDEVR